jgi:hypothetical protein
VLLTPLRGRKIVRILKADFSSTAIPIYHCGAANAQHVGPLECKREASR